MVWHILLVFGLECLGGAYLGCVWFAFGLIVDCCGPSVCCVWLRYYDCVRLIVGIVSCFCLGCWLFSVCFGLFVAGGVFWLLVCDGFGVCCMLVCL